MSQIPECVYCGLDIQPTLPDGQYQAGARHLCPDCGATNQIAVAYKAWVTSWWCRHRKSAEESCAICAEEDGE